jgi:hypothetical protein
MKIAFCFLTIGNIKQPKLWYKFFKGHEDKCNIYIHNKNNFVDKQDKFHKFSLKQRVPTRWGHISLVEATLLMFKQAFISDKENTFFILLSDSCIPLYNFDYIYEKISKVNNNIINVIPNRQIGRFSSFRNPQFFEKKTFFKQEQWICLHRITLKMYLDSLYYLNVFGNSFDVPDEHYFINIAYKHKISFISQPITFTNWKDNDSGNHPKLYNKLTVDEIESIKKENPTVFFMRKISSDCKLPNYLDI